MADKLVIILLICLLPYTTIIFAEEGKGQPEDVEHGSHRERESFQEQHYKDGEHDPHKDHEAFLGSKQYAKDFDKLPAEESKARLKKLAETKLDKNKSGDVDEQELFEWIFEHMKNLDAEEVQERFDEMDENRDGLVTWQEYRQEAFGGTNPEGAVLEPEDQKLLDEDTAYFKAADANGDEKLDKEEFGAFQNPEHFPHMHETVIETTLIERDLDKDGHINLDEFLGEYANKKDTEWYNAEKTRFADQYDADKDGRLNRLEMKTWLIPDLSEAARQEMRHLFNEADKNRDGVLTVQEIVDAHSIFVGSEATNYGEHLIRHTEL